MSSDDYVRGSVGSEMEIGVAMYLQGTGQAGRPISPRYTVETYEEASARSTTQMRENDNIEARLESRT